MSEVIDKGNVSEDIAKTIQVEDRTVENENAAESYLDKVQGETVKEAAVKLDLENKSGDTNFTKATTEVMTLEEKVSDLQFSPPSLPSKHKFFKRVKMLENKMDSNVINLNFGMKSLQNLTNDTCIQ